MKLLICAVGFSYPPTDGHDVQLCHLIGKLAARGYSITVLSVVRTVPALSRLRFTEAFPKVQLLDPILYPHRSPALALHIQSARFGVPSAVRRGIEATISELRPDVVHLQGFALLPLLSRLGGERVVFSIVDAWSRRQATLARQARGARKIARVAYAQLAFSMEWLFLHRASAVHVVAAGDASYYAVVMPRARVVTIPVMCDVPPMLGRMPRHPKSALFWGDIEVSYLREGLEILLRETWPRVQKEVPTARLTALCRRAPDGELRALADASVTFVPWSDDVDVELARHGIVLLPDQSGSGQKNRTVQALANGNAVVGTSFALEGLPILEGVHALRFGKAENAAGAIAELMLDEPRQRALGESGRQLVQAHHSREAVMELWEQLYRNIRAATDRR